MKFWKICLRRKLVTSKTGYVENWLRRNCFAPWVWYQPWNGRKILHPRSVNWGQRSKWHSPNSHWDEASWSTLSTKGKNEQRPIDFGVRMKSSKDLWETYCAIFISNAVLMRKLDMTEYRVQSSDYFRIKSTIECFRVQSSALDWGHWKN
jgi:hypothetical protein